MAVASASAGVMPAFTNQRSSRVFWPNIVKTASEPIAKRTPVLCAAGCIQVALQVGLQPFRDVRAIAELFARVSVVTIVVDRGNVESLPPGHLRQGLVIQVGCVFDRIGAGSHGVARALGAIRMDGDTFTELVRGVDGGFHFFKRKCLIARDVFATSGRPVHLDHVGARCDLLPHDTQDVGNPIGLASLWGNKSRPAPART